MTYLPQLTMPLSHPTRPLSLLTRKKFQPTTHQKLQRRMRLQLPPMMPLLLHTMPLHQATMYLRLHTKLQLQTTRLPRPRTVSHPPHTARLHQPTMLHPLRTTPLQLSMELLQVLTRLPNSTEPRCPRPLTLCTTVKSLLLRRPLPPGPRSRHSSRFLSLPASPSLSPFCLLPSSQQFSLSSLTPLSHFLTPSSMHSVEKESRTTFSVLYLQTIQPLFSRQTQRAFDDLLLF